MCRQRWLCFSCRSLLIGTTRQPISSLRLYFSPTFVCWFRRVPASSGTLAFSIQLPDPGSVVDFGEMVTRTKQMMSGATSSSLECGWDHRGDSWVRSRRSGRWGRMRGGMRFRGNRQQHERSHLSQARAASLALALAWRAGRGKRHESRTCGGRGRHGEGETGDSQGSRKTFDSATGSPPTQTRVCALSI